MKVGKTLLNKIIENKACLRHHFLSQACFNILSGNQWNKFNFCYWDVVVNSHMNVNLIHLCSGNDYSEQISHNLYCASAQLDKWV